MLISIKASGLSDQEIASFVGVGQSTINRLIHGIHGSTNFSAGKAIELLYAKVVMPAADDPPSSGGRRANPVNAVSQNREEVGGARTPARRLTAGSGKRSASH